MSILLIVNINFNVFNSKMYILFHTIKNIKYLVKKKLKILSLQLIKPKFFLVESSKKNYCF